MQRRAAPSRVRGFLRRHPPRGAADILRAGAETRRAVTANGNLRLAVALLAARIA